VGVDVVDLVGGKSGALQGHQHAAVGAVAILGGGGDVIGIARQAVARHLGIDFGAARLGVLEFLEHQNARTHAHDEAVAILVIGTRTARRLIVEFGGQRLAGNEASDAEAADRRFSTTGDDHVGIVQGN